MNFIYKYFNAERNESIVFILVGLIAIILGIYFLIKSENSLLKGMSYPLIAIALIQIIVGITIFLRTPSDFEKAQRNLENKSEIKAIEIPRMAKVMQLFSLLKKIEIALIIIGIILFFVFKNNLLLKGIAIGLVIQASIMLTMDLIAEKRAKIYLNHLKSFSIYLGYSKYSNM